MADLQQPGGSGAVRMFPIQGRRGRPEERIAPSTIPWSHAEWGYRCYAALYGTSQSLERLAERHGFGPGEMASCARDVVQDAPNRRGMMRMNVRGLPKGERPAEVSEELATQVEAILDGD